MLDERRDDLRKIPGFGATLVIAALALGLGAWRRGDASIAWVVGAALFGSAGLFALVAGRRALPLYRAWMALGMALGRVTTPVMLTILFVLVFTPIRLLLALFGRDPLDRGWDRSKATYFYERPRRGVSRSDFERLS